MSVGQPPSSFTTISLDSHLLIRSTSSKRASSSNHGRIKALQPSPVLLSTSASPLPTQRRRLHRPYGRSPNHHLAALCEHGIIPATVPPPTDPMADPLLPSAQHPLIITPSSCRSPSKIRAIPLPSLHHPTHQPAVPSLPLPSAEPTAAPHAAVHACLILPPTCVMCHMFDQATNPHNPPLDRCRRLRSILLLHLDLGRPHLLCLPPAIRAFMRVCPCRHKRCHARTKPRSRAIIPMRSLAPARGPNPDLHLLASGPQPFRKPCMLPA